MQRANVILLFLLAMTLTGRAVETIFDPNPDHIWNRLHNHLFIRVAEDGARYGADSVDILYWIGTKNLLEGASHEKTTKLLNEFIDAKAAALIQDPWKRALLQSRCWALFDWSTRKFSFDEKTRDACTDVQSRLAIIIRQVALSRDQIERLPNNLKDNHELSALADAKSDWINIYVPDDELTAQAHIRYFGARSAFTVMFRHADGRSAATNYLAQLRAFSPVWIERTNSDFQRMDQVLNPSLPQFPAKSQWALLRRMCVIDTEGKIRTTPIVETAQLRTFNKVPASKGVQLYEDLKDSQRMQEFNMRASDAALVEVSATDKSFTHFFSKGFDGFEQGWNNEAPNPAKMQRTTLNSCHECHGNKRGIISVHTFTRAFSREATMATPQIESADDWKNDADRSIRWKEQQYSWGLLQGLAWRNVSK
jgi:hypothetical protein